MKKRREIISHQVIYTSLSEQESNKKTTTKNKDTSNWLSWHFWRLIRKIMKLQPLPKPLKRLSYFFAWVFTNYCKTPLRLMGKIVVQCSHGTRAPRSQLASHEHGPPPGGLGWWARRAVRLTPRLMEPFKKGYTDIPNKYPQKSVEMWGWLFSEIFTHFFHHGWMYPWKKPRLNQCGIDSIISAG